MKHRPFPRQSGILLHPTALPGGQGIGDLGSEAYRFVDFLVAGRQSLWQVLPLNPLGTGDSPYAAPSAFAGNPLLLSLDLLADEGILLREEVAAVPKLPSGRVPYDLVYRHKLPLLRRALERFERQARGELRQAFDDFCSATAAWLDDYALFMALKEAHGGASWVLWEEGLATRRPEAIERARSTLAAEIGFHRFLQFAFHEQWTDLHVYASAHGIRIVGDLPIFVAHDSVDVWANRDLFHLDARGNPTVVAGVPPDYFSATGQRWGNPLYRWDAMAQTGFAWWVERFRATLAQIDILRIDHFRGFQAYWEVPAEHDTAEHGRWVEGPGEPFFETVEKVLGPLPIIVEDLGFITPEVTALRDSLGYPGMKVLQFAFDSGATNPYLPHNYHQNCVVYTATHDNDTTAGWFAGLSAELRAAVCRYTGTSGRSITWDMIRLALASVANTAIIPLQDMLRLGSGARMNFPGRVEGNWAWRCRQDDLAPERIERLAEMATTYGRDPRP